MLGFLTMFMLIYYKLLFNFRGKVEFGSVGDNMQNSPPEGGVGEVTL